MVKRKKSIFKLTSQPLLLDIPEDENKNNFIERLNIIDEFVVKHEKYLSNYINGDKGIAFGHIKNAYNKYVLNGTWNEEKFKKVLELIIERKMMFTSSAMLKMGIVYDENIEFDEDEFFDNFLDEIDLDEDDF